ncbi:MAG: hypothetical protein IMF18_09135 [Proteobacteria bacterium]|nr:hypothetical protein [Pseudomonadota bacterium]
MTDFLAHKEHAYHLQEHAILENEDGTYEYMAWDTKGEKLSWIRGQAKILGDVLGLTSITSQGEEETIETQLELKYELSQLPEWDKTKYYCVITQESLGGLLKYCGTGKFVMKGEQEYKAVQEKLKTYGVHISSE